MHRAISVATAAFSIFTLTQGEARADRVFVEPDTMAEGADLTFAYPGVVVTIDGEPDRVVRAAVGFSEFNNRNLATTGVLVFRQDPPGNVNVPLAFDDNIGALRADFLVPTDNVQIDMACDDNDIAEIRAFDALDNLLTTSNQVRCDGRTANATGTAVIRRSTADIAYVTAGGIGGEGLLLDNLQFNLFTPTCDVELSAKIYFQGETIRTDLLRIENTSSVKVPVEINLWIAMAGMEPFQVKFRRNITTLQPGFDEDFGSVRLANANSGMPIGQGEIVCRLIDPRSGGVYDTEVAPFEIQ